jgi:hypothetical protein
MCGLMVDDANICIRERGHDDGTHEAGWRVTTHVMPAPYARDSRESTTEHRISSGRMVFVTASLEHANWLAETLTELDAE